MANNDIRWIHISDIHIGNKRNKWLDDTLQKDFIYYLKNDIGRIDFILITGDIIDKGQYDNINLVKQAKSFLNSLKDVVNDHIIFAIGNHDYQREEARFAILKNWAAFGNKDDNSWKEKLKTNFKEYVSFIKSIMGEQYPITEDTYIYNMIDDISIIVMNTSIFSGQPLLNDKGEYQKDEKGNVIVCDEGKLWVSDSSFPTMDSIIHDKPTIVIGHHPIDYFQENAQLKFNAFLNRVNGKYLCGHMHKSDYSNGKNISSGLFKDNYNFPEFSYNIMHKGSNSNIYTTQYVYDKIWHIYNAAITYDNLDSAQIDILKDIEKGRLLYFFGLQGSTFLQESFIDTIKKNKKLTAHFLVSDPYSYKVRDRIRQMPQYSHPTKYDKKWRAVVSRIKALAEEYNEIDNATIKYHKIPLMFRVIFTSYSFYIGIYENTDSSKSKIYRFDKSSELYKSAISHFELAWSNAKNQHQDLLPDKAPHLLDKFPVIPSLVINVTDKCNMHCLYCPEGGENLCKDLTPCSIESIKHLIKVFANNIEDPSKRVIRITGGEPLLPQAQKTTSTILEEAYSNRYNKIVLCTNGIFFRKTYLNNRKAFDNVKESLLLKISLDSLNDDIFDKMTRTTNLLCKVKDSIKFASEQGFRIELNIVATDMNVDEIINIYKYATSLHLVGIKVLTVNDFGGKVKMESSASDRLSNLIQALKQNNDFSYDLNLFLNDNKGIEMKRFKDQNGCTITIVDHENNENSITPRRVFCSECTTCKFYSPDSYSDIKPCATGVMSITMRTDGELSFCRLMNGVNINNQKMTYIKNEVKKRFDMFKNCHVSGTTNEDDYE